MSYPSSAGRDEQRASHRCPCDCSRFTRNRFDLLSAGLAAEARFVSTIRSVSALLTALRRLEGSALDRVITIAEENAVHRCGREMAMVVQRTGRQLHIMAKDLGMPAARPRGFLPEEYGRRVPAVGSLAHKAYVHSAEDPSRACALLDIPPALIRTAPFVSGRREMHLTGAVQPRLSPANA